MPQATSTLDLTRLQALIGRLLSHGDELAGRVDIAPQLTSDVQMATQLIDDFADHLALLAGRLNPPDMPEPGRSSHYSG
jgi:hypothetical protein